MVFSRSVRRSGGAGEPSQNIPNLIHYVISGAAGSVVRTACVRRSTFGAWLLGMCGHGATPRVTIGYATDSDAKMRPDSNHAQILEALAACGWYCFELSEPASALRMLSRSAAVRMRAIEIKDGRKPPWASESGIAKHVRASQFLNQGVAPTAGVRPEFGHESGRGCGKITWLRERPELIGHIDLGDGE